MCQTLYHRGPDEDGYFESNTASLGMRRLSIVDLESGQQPIGNETKDIWTVFNGEIYNHVELRRALIERGHVFSSDHSDTEVIVHLYEEHGEDWPELVNGMFALAIWDSRVKRLLLYRDRIGKKPLYYANINGQMIFGSEIKALLKHPVISSRLDYQALYHYFGLKNTSAPRTAYADIKQLLPGHILIWELGEIRTRPYWQLNFGAPLKNISEEEASEHLLELLEDAVKLRMQCDVPYGAYLSGGVDSSSVVAIMSQQQSRPVKTFCLGYEDKPSGQFFGKAQDIVYSRSMSDRLGTEHHEYIISAKEFSERMPEILLAFDEPFSGVVSTFFISILIKRHVKVALSGDGADELFGSYLSHRMAFPIEHFLSLVGNGKKDWKDLDQEDRDALKPFDSPEQFLFLKSIASKKISDWRGSLHVFNHAERGELLTRGFLHESGYPKIKDLYRELEPQLTAKDILNKSLEIDQNELLPNQVLPFVDRLSMAHSVEVRVPYLDYRIIEFSDRLPGKFKIKDGIVKYIHKRTMERLLPKDLVERPKEGFVQPIYSWMHTALKGWVERSLDALPGEFFNQRYVQKLKRRFQVGDESVNAKIWNLVCFSIWYEGKLT
jgi:asparagine synthase (glutamine-hydrolysing)